MVRLGTCIAVMVLYLIGCQDIGSKPRCSQKNTKLRRILNIIFSLQMSGMRPGVPGMYPSRMNGQGMHPGMGMMGNVNYPPGQSDTPSMSPRTDKTNISKLTPLLITIKVQDSTK